MKGSSTLIAFIGVLATVVGLGLINAANYGLPPLPTGYVLSMILLVAGGSGIVSSIVMITHSKIQMKQFYVLNLILACILVGLGIRTILKHPLETPPCPCAPNFFGPNCEPCTCVNGVCDDGVEGTGLCNCELGWNGDPSCSTCSPTFQGENCDKCKRNFWKPEEGCLECFPPYSDGPNGACSQCSPGFKTENDDLGLLCRHCLPHHYGGYCKYANTTQCKEDGDTLAFAVDNDWIKQNVYTGNTCTSSTTTCEHAYDCEGVGSFNCKGQCVSGDLSNGQLCEMDIECESGYTCKFKTCCLEKKVQPDFKCECGRSGYMFDGNKCASCPGFDGIFSASICSGHGTCAAAYGGDPNDDSSEIVAITCICNIKEKWSGDECSCLTNGVDNTCIDCANGYYGSKCSPCDGGGGLMQCSGHGVCADGIEGDGSCTCDLDTKYRGLGAWSGDTCSSCANSDFYDTERCWPCPNFKLVSCDSSNSNPFLPNQCSYSCTSATTCNSNSGMCENL